MLSDRQNEKLVYYIGVTIGAVVWYFIYYEILPHWLQESVWGLFFSVLIAAGFVGLLGKLFAKIISEK